METEVIKEGIKKVQAPQPEPTTFGKCLITSRSPIGVPANAPKESFDKYGFFKYQPLKQFEPGIDLYPIQKNAKSGNALFRQMPDKIDIFILQKGKLPSDSLVNSTILQLLEASKVNKSKPVASYSRENFIFHEKTLSSKLLFIDKGTTQVKIINLGTNSYYHISLPIFVLSSSNFYDYRKEKEYVYFLGTEQQFSEIRDNNNGAENPFLSSLPQWIEDKIMTGNCTIDSTAYPYFNKFLESDNINAPRAWFKLRSYSTPELDEPVNMSLFFQEQTGAFLMNLVGVIVGKTVGNQYEVEYQFYQPNSSNLHPEKYYIRGKLRIYGYNPNISMERHSGVSSISSSLPSAWQGMVFRATENDNIKSEVFENLSDELEGKPSGCPPS